MTQKPVRLVFLGAGIVAGPYSKAVSRLDSVEFAGAFDPIQEKAQAAVSQLGGKVYRDLDEVLNDDSVDGAIVMNPNHLHVETATACLEAGKHVMIEKPVAETVDEIDQLAALATKVNRVCMPAHNYIYVPGLVRAKQFVEEGRLGKISSLWILYNLYHDEEIGRIYGGVLREVCVHHAYSLVYLLGRPQRVSAVSSCVHYEELTCEDQVMVTCEMQDGALAQLWASFAASDPTSDPWTVVYKLLGTKGGVNYTWNEAQFEDSGGPAWGIPNYLDGFANELQFFAEQAIPFGKTPRSPLQHARDAICIIQTAEESIRTGNGMVEVSYK